MKLNLEMNRSEVKAVFFWSKFQLRLINFSIKIFSVRQLLFLLLFCCLGLSSCAHGDLGRRITAKTKAIEKDPKNALLYMERGFLYQQHEEWDFALADYIHSQQLGQKDKVLYFRMAEVYQKLLLFKSGLVCTEQYLKEDSVDVKVHKLRGQLFVKAKDYDAAIASFQFVLEHAVDLTPDNFLMLAAAYHAKNRKKSQEVLAVMDKSIEHFGPKVFALQEQKLEYLKTFKDVDEALEQYDVIIDIQNRKESWLYKKAAYLYEYKKYEAAKETVEAAETAFSQLKAHKQKTKAMIQLLANIHTLKLKLENREN